MCPFIQGKLLHSHCIRSASIMILILVELRRINSYYLIIILWSPDICVWIIRAGCLSKSTLLK